MCLVQRKAWENFWLIVYEDTRRKAQVRSSKTRSAGEFYL